MGRRTKRYSIISRESDSKTLDVALLEEELLSRGCDVTVMSKLLTKGRPLKSIGYIWHVLKQEAAILSSDVVVLDTYCIPASMIPHRKRTKIVQMWHALGAIKKFGWQTVGKEDGSSEAVARLMKMHNGYDYVVSASDITAAHFCEAFRVSPEKIVKYGLPRIDYIKSVSYGSKKGEMLERIHREYPQLNNGRKTILYAPTFRRGKTLDAQILIDTLDSEKYNIVVKLHPLYRGKTVGIEGGFDTVVFDDVFSPNDWLAATDIIISDYSSFVIESTLANKPLFIYAYDLDEYERTTGLNIDYYSEPISPYVFREAKELAKTIDSGEYDMKVLQAFRDRYIDIKTDDESTADNPCTAALADFIESI